MRIRRRERLFLALKGYGTFMYTSNHTSLLPSKRRQKQLGVDTLLPVYLLLFMNQIMHAQDFPLIN